jgi:predicted nucleic acid-binding Zn ribbon protein
LDDPELCEALWGLEDNEVPPIFESLNAYMREDVVGEGRASGLDVMALSGGDERYQVGGCSLDLTHKYICDDTTGDILPHERRWKDTTMVHKYSVFILRVRWASTTYDPQVQPYPYFRIPE